ncbi:hypothetical protein OSJ20_23625 [Mycobacterium ulcerans]|uniref:Uncharacterized protein n=1 Tax=Mycobacterium ulcerans str. Harvey TaxID=1299332 RepID=A0ABP3ARM9_MYCUL|nr:hypothetical protein I551_0947 [Mycobacterium ulcerans str. Harvey]MEB4336236.1 hypothetical protein [Mycobacterium ulcerans]MEB4391056.1 hypothetical protein [Mycobacterium ulcerans]MEB4426490.1 hypothetical protein [Mycobacterium ulcerans]
MSQPGAVNIARSIDNISEREPAPRRRRIRATWRRVCLINGVSGVFG